MSAGVRLRVLVTGAGGFVGRHLTAHLIAGGSRVTGLVHPSDRAPIDVESIAVDLLDETALWSAVAGVEPDVIYHLAAFSNPQDSLTHARETLETNVIGTQNLLSGAIQTGKKPKVLLVGSAQQYGHVETKDQPIVEDHPLEPLSPYSVSKVAQELLGRHYTLSGELPVFLSRAFNHTGPGQAPSYVCSNFAKQVVEVEKELRAPEIRVGNLEARRDFSDVRDVVRAYEAILERGTPGRAYNVCRGEAVSIRQVLDTLVSLSEARVTVVTDPARYHELDAPLIVGSHERLRKDTGWSPGFPLRDTLRDLLDDWRRKL